MRSIAILSVIFVMFSELCIAERLSGYGASGNSSAKDPVVIDTIPVLTFQTSFRRISDFVFFGDKFTAIEPDTMLAINCSEVDYINASKKMSILTDYYLVNKVTPNDVEIYTCIDYARWYLLKTGLDKYVKIKKDDTYSAYEDMEDAFFVITALNGVSFEIPFDCYMNNVGVDYLPECSWANFHLSYTDLDYGSIVVDLKNGTVLKIKGNANSITSDSVVVFTSDYFHGANLYDGSVPTISYVISGIGKIIYLDLFTNLQLLSKSSEIAGANWIFSGYVVLEDESVYIKCSNVQYINEDLNYRILGDKKYYKIVRKRNV